MNERKPDASSQPTFAERVAEIERGFSHPIPAREAEMIRALLACIREQQAALEACEKSWNYVFTIHTESQAAERVRAVLARWRIEK